MHTHLMFFDKNINGNRDVKFLECDYLLVQRCMKLTLSTGNFFTGVMKPSEEMSNTIFLFLCLFLLIVLPAVNSNRFNPTWILFKSS